MIPTRYFCSLRLNRTILNRDNEPIRQVSKNMIIYRTFSRLGETAERGAGGGGGMCLQLHSLQLRDVFSALETETFGRTARRKRGEDAGSARG